MNHNDVTGLLTLASTEIRQQRSRDLDDDISSYATENSNATIKTQALSMLWRIKPSSGSKNG
jgi:hypothetical protein